MVLLAVGDGRFVLSGLRARQLGLEFSGLPFWRISNILSCLVHLGLIRRVVGSYKYYLTGVGRRVIAAGLYLKNQVLIPALAKA